MRYQTIPGTELNPSVICLGALPFGVSLSEQTSFELLDRYFAGGGNFIDTALVYGEWLPGGKGLSEKTVGKWVTAKHNRTEAIIGTKGAHPRLSSMQTPRLSKAEIISDLEESLDNLQTDYIDLYWLHRDDPERPIAEIITTLYEQLQAGKIRYFGCSNWRVERIKEAQTFAATYGLPGFVGNQLRWSLALPNPSALFDPTTTTMDAAMKVYHQQSGLAAMAYTSQARGFFSKLANSSREKLPETLKREYLNPENLTILTRLTELAAEKVLSVGVLALAYLVSQPFPTYPIASCSTLEQLLENLAAGAVELEPFLLDYLEGKTSRDG
jgi:aryl-alcohol dehydrogenase-like predicted oxidoreductase